MITFVTIGRRLDPHSKMVHTVESGRALAVLARDLAHPLWSAGESLVYFVGGAQVDADAVPEDGDLCMAVPSIGETAPITAGGSSGSSAAAGLSALSIVFTVVAVLGTMYSYWRAKQQLRATRRAEELRKLKPYGFDSPSLTSYGEGFRIPFGYGEYRTGGAIIGSRLEQSPLFRLGTELHLLVALGEGPIEAIGGLTLEPSGEANYLTGATYTNNGIPDPRFPFNTWLFPSGLLINDLQASPSALSVSLRKGKLNQSPLPDWPGAHSSVDVGGPPLVTVGSSTTYETTEEDIWRIVVELYFPEGLWYEGASGNIRGRVVNFAVDYRLVGSGTWQGRNVAYEANPPVLNPFSYFVDVAIFPTGGGPFEVRITRLVEDGNAEGGRVHSTFQLKSIQIQFGGGGFEYGFSHPGLSLMALRIPATEQVSGQITNVSVPVRGLPVAGWVNASLQWTPPLWGWVGPWLFPLSSNPAWVFVDVCLNKRYGLGSVISQADLDLPAFRNWADLCDQPHPLDEDEALLRWDGQIDAGDPATEVLAAIAAAGRAIPVLIGGNKLSVKFSYRDGFSRGSGASLNEVPDRIPVGIITTSQVHSFECTYNDPATAPVVIDAQILDRASDYQMRTISAEDRLRLSTDNGRDPRKIAPRRESIAMLGVVRRLQARYEIQLMHNYNRLSRVTAKVKMPIEAIAYEIGDLVLFQNDAMLTGGATVESWATGSARTTNAGTVSELLLSKPVAVIGSDPRTMFGVWIRDVDGVVHEFTADLDDPVTLQPGTPLPLWDPVGSTAGSVEIQRGTAVMVGLYTETKRVMEIIGITTTQDLLREVHLAEWHPDMFDLPDGFDETDGMGDDDPPPVDELAPTVHVDVQGEMTAGGDFRSTSSLRWSPAPWDASTSRRARVYARTSDGRYSLLGESETDVLENLRLHVGAEYDVHVCRQDARGRFPFPTAVPGVAVTVPEFGAGAPTAPVRLVAQVDLDRVHLSWPHVDDAIGYELRRGGAWYGAEVVAALHDVRHTVVCPAAGTATYRVRARGRSGLYSESEATAVVTWAPLTTVATETYLTADLSGGTASSVVWDATAEAAAIDEDEYRGTWTSDELDVGADTLLYWSASATVWAEDGGSLAPFTLGAPERFFEVAGGRQSTRLYPGHDFDAGAAADVAGEYADPDESAATMGDWVRTVIETRFYVDGAWGSWSRHVPGRRLAAKMQARVILDRYALDIEAYASDLVLTAGF